MARSGDVLHHPVTGERLVWRRVAGDTNGALLEGDMFSPPGGFIAAEHIHPRQEERFEVLAGTLTLRVDGREQTVSAGGIASILAGQRHVWWNAGPDEVHIRAKITPALRTEVFFETLFGLAADGKTNRKGLPNPLQLAVLMRDYQDELRLAGLPFGIQRAVFGPLAILGRLLGYRGRYARYSARPEGVQSRVESR